MTDGARHCLTDRFDIPLPPHDALRLFTARGEQDWVPGWKPRFPVPTLDDGEPGTVFETESRGRITTWVVVDRELGHRIRYACVTPGVRAGTVDVTLIAVTPPSGAIHSEVTVVYELTALNDAAKAELQDFADEYPEFIRSWQKRINMRIDA